MSDSRRATRFELHGEETAGVGACPKVGGRANGIVHGDPVWVGQEDDGYRDVPANNPPLEETLSGDIVGP